MRLISVLLSVLLILPGALDAGNIECVTDCYESELGVREVGGNNQGKAVGKYLASTGLDEGYAWCAAFVNWCLEECGFEGPSKAAWSPSWFSDSHTAYHRGESESYHPSPGDVFGIYFRSKGRIAHVGFIDQWQDDYAITVEGNTNAAGSREGDGVYRKRRPHRTIYKVANWTR